MAWPVNTQRLGEGCLWKDSPDTSGVRWGQDEVLSAGQTKWPLCPGAATLLGSCVIPPGDGFFCNGDHFPLSRKKPSGS